MIPTPTLDFPNGVHVEVSSLGNSETHNGGKRPLIITLSDPTDRTRSFKLVVKPRTAEIDKAVIDVFDKINLLPPEKRSGIAPLPTYKIVTPTEAEGWSHTQGV